VSRLGPLCAYVFGVDDETQLRGDGMNDPGAVRAVWRAVLRRGALAPIVAVLLLGSPVAARGATVPLTIERMAALSDAVVLARVSSASARQVAPERPGEPPSVVTDAVLSVERALKGARGTTVLLTVAGGRAGGVGMIADESPSFRVGDRCVVFLDSADRVVGGRRGKADISGDQVPFEDLDLDAFIARVTGTTVVGGLRAATVAELAAGGTAVTAAFLPAIVGISPAVRPAGTLSVVTISGTGFGTAPGRVYFAGEQGSRVAAPLVTGSWTDTSVVCAVPAGAGSGPVTVGTASFAQSPGYAYTVGFSWLGLHWNGARMPYYLDTPDAGRRAEVTRAVDAWNAVSPAAFVFAVEVALTPPLGVTAHNDVRWVDTYSPYSTILAQNRMWYDSLGHITHSDITFNASEPWGDGTGGTFSIARVAAHELGHSLSLADQYGDGDKGELMYWLTYSGTTLSSIPPVDADGLRWIYDPAFTGADPTAKPTELSFSAPPAPVATSLSLASSPRRPRVRRWMTLYGAVAPGTSGDAVTIQMRKPRSRRWSTVAEVGAGPDGSWSWRYRPRSRGTHYFRAYYGGAADRYGSWSRTIAVRVR
jgi:hypothetical protein